MSLFLFVFSLSQRIKVASQELQRIVSRSLDLLYSGLGTPSGLQTDCDYPLVIKAFEQQIVAWLHEWTNTRSVTTSECFLYAVLPISFLLRP